MKTKSFFKLNFCVLLTLLLSTKAYSQGFKYPFQNYNLSFEERAEDLVARLTLEEKVSQMLNSAPAISRLGIPAHDWWNEVLHGVARTPYNVTVFPQAIALAATFDTAALYRMADYSALEGRAVYRKAVESGREGAKYQGLTYWTPNINIFRDPRWGRGQETYGEDPFLTAQMGDAFVRGLQGDDPKYLKAAACAKHFAVHSGPEPLRHVFDVDVSAYDLWDTYLPAFRKLVVDSKVTGVMCAYNAFRTQPCCANDVLSNDILRNQWNFKGYVTSDCGAIDDFYKKHKTHANAEEASADAVFHGTDLDCGKEAYYTLVQAVKDGKINEKQIDISVKRLFLVRFRLGLFDPVNLVKYAQTPISELESPAHKQHALQMARESMVLLKNDNQTLPLSKTLKKIVILGPNADNPISILGNYNGTPSELTTVLKGIQQKVSNNTEVIYEKAVNFTDNNVLIYKNIENQFSFEGKLGFKAMYYNNKFLSGQPSDSRYESTVNNSWQEGENVIGSINATDFSARYITDYKPISDQKLTLELEADNGYRLFVNDKLVLDEWVNKHKETKRYELDAKADSVYKFVIEFWQEDGPARVKFSVGNYVRTNFNNLVDKYKDADAFIFVGGISPQLEGEQMRVDEPGFSGGDRTSILLPEIQTKLMQALKTTDKPIIFVMMTGSAIATPWQSKNIPSILNAWYGGQATGTAVADILFGDYNPSGKLPVTFYSSDSDLPEFTNYSMENRTYRYFTGKPLYGFGFGLSYSTFKYKNLNIKEQKNNSHNLSVSVKITNKSTVAGDEIVQLYIVNKNESITTSLKTLKGFQRIKLGAGESSIVKFTLTPEDLSYIDSTGKKCLLTGKVEISVGGSQPDEPNKTSGNIAKKTLYLK